MKSLTVSDKSVPAPRKFTFPFYYDPHPWAIQAAEELMHYLEQQTDFVHNFGLDPSMSGPVIGKMFGVLVVETPSGEIGYLQAVSGKLANSNHHRQFVPPVFDMLTDGSFFLEGEKELNCLNDEIEQLENSEQLQHARSVLQDTLQRQKLELTTLKEEIKAGKMKRDQVRKTLPTGETDRETLLEELRRESIREQYFLKDLQRQHRAEAGKIQDEINVIVNEIAGKKEERKTKSNALQHLLFTQYHFLNARSERKSLLDLFVEDLKIVPPAGAGECAAPKLLHYAYANGLKPLALAEFWWGASPASEVRKHRQYYPACRGKCEPILGHMLQGLNVAENPLLQQPAAPEDLDIVYEDDVLLVINKPAEFLSVPGITLKDSVYERARKRYPDATGPLIVHRLDMSTSGLMVLAKTMDAYRRLQKQFLTRTVKKRYVALLTGEVQNDKGTIDLPLRVDLDDRPRQLVCHEYGRRALTEYEVLERKEGKTRVHFYPLTGRTHQLRVHASHSRGLNAPIIGDDLYGAKNSRLHLHAEFLEFVHPENGKKVFFEADAPF